ncbi:unnamed protein product [Linum tenue]|uniref:Uncharacterized protein n=1 Tax=Linum tenue TaxID=586396 RepID=A0AAV0QYH0_9ROSI|nr:unnamed protein product [Linum tenue]
MVRTPSCDQNGMRKGTWTAEEDRKLIAYVTRYGCWNWRQLPKFAGLKRCGKSCRLRWMNYLRPNVKRGNYSKEEEETILNLHSSLGNRWSAIAAHLPGRSDNEIKNHWHTSLKKRARQRISQEVKLLDETQKIEEEKKVEIPQKVQVPESSSTISSTSASTPGSEPSCMSSSASWAGFGDELVSDDASCFADVWEAEAAAAAAAAAEAYFSDEMEMERELYGGWTESLLTTESYYWQVPSSEFFATFAADQEPQSPLFC